MHAALAGGVGAAKFLDGVTRAVEPASLTAIVNTADDDVFHGLCVSPDLDSVTYMLAGASDRGRGWGLENETFTTLEALGRFGVATWFQLGDRDLATHIYRTMRMNEGATLSEATAEIVRAWNIESTILPMSDDPVRTMLSVETSEPGQDTELAMQEWFVRDRTLPSVRSVRFEGTDAAKPAPGVIEALENAESILICPSNPIISTGPILAVPGVRETVAARRQHVVAVSPIVGDRAVRGPADRLMHSLGFDTTCVAVARIYADICATIVIDEVDAHHSEAIETLGVRAVVTDTLMNTPDVAAALAAKTLDVVS